MHVGENRYGQPRRRSIPRVPGSFYLNCAYAGSSPPGRAPMNRSWQRTLHFSKPSMVLAKPLSRILYVDDDASMRELVNTALAGQEDFSVVTCTSGFEALIIIGQQRPDLILLDVAMPRLDGVETLECLRAMELGHHTPVVFMAAGLSQPELRRLQLAGAAEVIQVPFDAAALPALIRSIWSRIAQ